MAKSNGKKADDLAERGRVAQAFGMFATAAQLYRKAGLCSPHGPERDARFHQSSVLRKKS